MIGIKKNKVSKIANLPIKIIDRKMGFSRGTPIDRVYINKFLNENKKYITGNVMEIAENSYTKQFGHEYVSYILTNEKNVEGTIYGDLTSGIGCEENSIDCFILTQTLPFMYDIENAMTNIFKMLKTGGNALITVRGISMVSEYDRDRWGDYWGFTKQSLQKLFEKTVPTGKVTIESYGNAKIATAFLYGLSKEDLKESDFLYNDPLIPVMIVARLEK